MALEDPQVVRARQDPRQGPLRPAHHVVSPSALIESLPRNLSTLDAGQLRGARDCRDARMSILFRDWASLSTMEMRELRRLSDERQRLARHVGTTKSYPAVRA
jgi:hypothetical protein